MRTGTMRAAADFLDDEAVDSGGAALVGLQRAQRQPQLHLAQVGLVAGRAGGLRVAQLAERGGQLAVAAVAPDLQCGAVAGARLADDALLTPMVVARPCAGVSWSNSLWPSLRAWPRGGQESMRAAR